MIEIERVECDLSRSKINGKIVDELPEGLKRRLIDLLEKFDGVYTITIGDCAENTTLVTDEPFTLFEFAGEDEGLTGELFFVRKLYKFWYRKKWQNSALGCSFCGAEVKTGEICDKLRCQQMAKEFDSIING